MGGRGNWRSVDDGVAAVGKGRTGKCNEGELRMHLETEFKMALEYCRDVWL